MQCPWCETADRMSERASKKHWNYSCKNCGTKIKVPRNHSCKDWGTKVPRKLGAEGLGALFG